MINFLSENLYLLFLLPLWNFLIIMIGRFFSVYVNNFILYFLTLLSSFLGIIVSGCSLLSYLNNQIYEYQIPFIRIKDFIISGGIYVDKISLSFALTLFLVSFLVQTFSIFYMQKNKKNYRFFALLNLFNFSLAGMFFSPNLFQMYVFWEVTAIVSYLLIGFDYQDNKKSFASKKVFLINRIGDTALIAGILYCSYIMYEYSSAKSLTTLSLIDMNTISTFVYAYTSTPLFLLLCGLFIIAAFVKSAQFPFHTWLQDAMEAKLPVSALLHSATLVASGLYLIIRLMQFFILHPITLQIIYISAIITIILCSVFALTENNPKKVLAYSTSAQYGLIFLASAQLNLKVALLLYIAHAFIKSTLFLTLPNKENVWNKYNLILFVLSAFSLCGLIFSGFEAKELLMASLNIKGFIIASAFLTALYMTRLFFLIKNNAMLVKQKIKTLEFLPATGLLFLNIVFSIYLRKNTNFFASEPIIFAILGIFVVSFINYKKYNILIPLISPLLKNGLYIDYFYTKILSKFYENFSNLCSKFDTKILSDYNLLISAVKFIIKANNFIEEKIINNFIRSVVKISGNISIFDLKNQTGNIQNYNAYALIILTVIIAFLVIIYTAILSIIGS